jgi:hypothetical protein
MVPLFMEESKTNGDPFSYNFVSMKKSQVDDIPVPAATDVMIDPNCHSIGVALGLKEPKDWNKSYDKVFTITEWAKERYGVKDPNELVKWIRNIMREMPSLGAKQIDDLYTHIKMGIKKGKDNES